MSELVTLEFVSEHDACRHMQHSAGTQSSQVRMKSWMKWRRVRIVFESSGGLALTMALSGSFWNASM